MAIVVNALKGQGPPPEKGESPDGRLTVQVERYGHGVLLKYDGSGDDEPPTRVRFERRDDDGLSRVRTGDPALAPGGYALAYDHEAPVGVGVHYVATPLDGDHEGGESKLGVEVDRPRGTYKDGWLKAPSNPALSRRLIVTDRPELEWKARTKFSEVRGNRAQVPVWDVREHPTGTLQVATETTEEADDLRALMREEFVLFQSEPAYGYGSMFLSLGDVKSSQPAPFGPIQWELEFTQVQRPDTANAPFRMGVRTYRDVATTYSEYSDLPQSADTYLDLALGG